MLPETEDGMQPRNWGLSGLSTLWGLFDAARRPQRTAQIIDRGRSLELELGISSPDPVIQPRNLNRAPCCPLPWRRCLQKPWCDSSYQIQMRQRSSAHISTWYHNPAIGSLSSKTTLYLHPKWKNLGVNKYLSTLLPVQLTWCLWFGCPHCVLFQIINTSTLPLE